MTGAMGNIDREGIYRFPPAEGETTVELGFPDEWRANQPRLEQIITPLALGDPCDCGRYPTTHRARQLCLDAQKENP